MTDRAEEGEEKRRFRGRNDPFHPPFYPPFCPPEPWPFPTPLYRPFIEAQRSLLMWYRDQLERYTGDNGFDDRLREALNALMTSWLDAAQSFREQREQALRLQSELVTRYLDVLDQLLDRSDDREP
jgi:hypothetical protein